MGLRHNREHCVASRKGSNSEYSLLDLLDLLVGSIEQTSPPGDQGTRSIAGQPHSSASASVSVVEQINQPSRSCYVRPRRFGALAQFPIRSHKCDRTSGFGDDGYKQVVTAPGCMEDGDAFSHSWLDAAAGLPLEDHDNGLGQRSLSDCGANSLYEHPGRSRSILPPAGRTRADHIRRIDQNHDFSRIVPMIRFIPRRRKLERCSARTNSRY